MGIWDRFEGIVQPDEVNNVVSRTPIEAGDYDVVLEKIEPSETQTGLPKLSATFRTKSNKVIFYNHTLQSMYNFEINKFLVKEATEFVGQLLGEPITFKGIPELANLIECIPVGGDYRINVSYADKDVAHKYPKVRVIKNYSVDEELF